MPCAPAAGSAAEVCADCARKRRRAPLAILGAAAAAAALVGGAAVALDAASRRQQKTPRAPDQPREQPQTLGDLGRALRGNLTNSTLAQYSRDLTEAARKNELDPVIGRDDEVERVVSILARRSKNNPVLIGEPGRRQDRHRRGPGAAHRARRRAAGAARQARAGALAGPAGGRHQVPRRVRGPRQAHARRGQAGRARHHPVHRRAAHAGRRGRRGRLARPLAR